MKSDGEFEKIALKIMAKKPKKKISSLLTMRLSDIEYKCLSAQMHAYIW